MTAKVSDGDVIEKYLKTGGETGGGRKDTGRKTAGADGRRSAAAANETFAGLGKRPSFDTDKLGSDGEIIRGNTEKRRIIHETASFEPVHVKVNGTKVTLPLKQKPIFVDVFDVYPFDLTKAGEQS